MADKGGNSNTVAIVAILVMAVLVIGGVYFMQGNGTSNSAAAPAAESQADDGPSFSMDVTDENGNSAKFESE